MDWLQIAQSVIAGVLYFSAWSILFYLFNVVRNKRLERRLRRLIKPGGVKCERERVHVIVANYTNVDVQVRRLELITRRRERVPLTYSGDIGEVELDFGDLQEFADKWRATGGDRFRIAGLRDRGFVELPPQTGGYWTLEEDELLAHAGDVVGCLAVVEYPTIFRGRALVQVDGGEDVVAAIRKAYDAYLQEQDEPARQRPAARV